MGSNYKEHGLKEHEYNLIKELLKREPTELELGIFGVLWSEHCSYKSSKGFLKKFPKDALYVIQGPGENAGIIEIDNSWVVFKVESHNHPSYIEPFNGAATGIGGIIRDIISMGARPIALLDILRFGEPSYKETKRITKGVVKGISFYGNCIGVPTVGGETFFDKSYNTNPLVNVFCLGIMPKGKFYRSLITKEDEVLFLFGSETGRDGIHGATMASANFGDDKELKKSHVQIGDPYYGKKIIETLMEMIELDIPVGIQDLGAGGISGAIFEMCAKSGFGAEITLDTIPLREKDMGAYEIMLSETQERMIVILEKENVQKAIDICNKFSVPWCVLGFSTKEKEVKISFKGEKILELNPALITENIPYCNLNITKEYEVNREEWLANDISEDSFKEILEKFLRSPNIGCFEHIYSQYDYQIGTNTAITPGSDAAVLRVKWPEKPRVKSQKKIAITAEGNARFVYLDPFEGGKYLVSEAVRNLSCVGAKALAFSDCLNFGNPERDFVAYQLSKSIEGISKALEEFNLPIISGNVSLYNETKEGENIRNILPTPVLVAVGVIDENTPIINELFKEPSEIFIIGNLSQKLFLSGSEFQNFIKKEIFGKLPKIDLEKEKALSETLINLIKSGLILSAHDISIGGLIVNLLESSFKSDFGFDLKLYPEENIYLTLFSENPTRAVVTVKEKNVDEFKDIVEQNSLDWLYIGSVIEESIIKIYSNESLVCEAPKDKLRNVWKNSISELF